MVGGTSFMQLSATFLRLTENKFLFSIAKCYGKVILVIKHSDNYFLCLPYGINNDVFFPRVICFYITCKLLYIAGINAVVRLLNISHRKTALIAGMDIKINL